MWQLRGLVASSGPGGVSSVADTLREVLAEVAEAYNQVRQHTAAQLRAPADSAAAGRTDTRPQPNTQHKRPLQYNIPTDWQLAKKKTIPVLNISVTENSSRPGFRPNQS